jgi:hypothetical protein
MREVMRVATVTSPGLHFRLVVSPNTLVGSATVRHATWRNADNGQQYSWKTS